MVDNGSSVKIMYKATLVKIGLTVNQRACATTIYEFEGEGTVHMGAIDLVVTLGEYPISVTMIAEFLVVDIIHRRPLLISFGAVSSVRHQSVKFPTPRGIGIIWGDQLAARECYNISTSGWGNAAAQTLVLIGVIGEAPVT